MSSNEFMKGANMAYNDCADLVDTMVKDLPAELVFMADGLSGLSAGMREKLHNMEILISNAETKQ